MGETGIEGQYDGERAMSLLEEIDRLSKRMADAEDKIAIIVQFIHLLTDRRTEIFSEIQQEPQNVSRYYSLVELCGMIENSGDCTEIFAELLPIFRREVCVPLLWLKTIEFLKHTHLEEVLDVVSDEALFFADISKFERIMEKFVTYLMVNRKEVLLSACFWDEHVINALVALISQLVFLSQKTRKQCQKYLIDHLTGECKCATLRIDDLHVQKVPCIKYLSDKNRVKIIRDYFRQYYRKTNANHHCKEFYIKLFIDSSVSCWYNEVEAYERCNSHGTIAPLLLDKGQAKIEVFAEWGMGFSDCPYYLVIEKCEKTLLEMDDFFCISSPDLPFSECKDEELVAEFSDELFSFAPHRRKAVKELFVDLLKLGIYHDDLHQRNVMLLNDKIVLIDFELCIFLLPEEAKRLIALIESIPLEWHEQNGTGGSRTQNISSVRARKT